MFIQTTQQIITVVNGENRKMPLFSAALRKVAIFSEAGHNYLYPCKHPNLTAKIPR
jgi:hypothetical protein